MKILKLFRREPKPQAKMVPYLTKELFQQLNDDAVKRKANRAVTDELINSLSDTNKYPIVQTFLHNDIEMRCSIVFNENGNTCWLDIPLKEYHSLPTFANIS